MLPGIGWEELFMMLDVGKNNAANANPCHMFQFSLMRKEVVIYEKLRSG